MVVAEGTVEETENQGDEKGEGEEEREREVEGELQLEEDEIDLRRYRPAGGPIVMTILELPPPPKTVGQWTIRRGQSVDMYIRCVDFNIYCIYTSSCSLYLCHRFIVYTQYFNSQFYGCDILPLT